MKYRFSPAVIEKLLEIDYSQVTEEMVKTNLEHLYTEISEDNADLVLRPFPKRKK